MKISNRCRYATLALFDIAFHSDGEPTQVKQIAKRQEIPARFLEQIFQDLRRAELVDGKRGRNGGYFLHREPSEIALRDIIQATDGPIELDFPQSDDGESKQAKVSADSRSIPASVWRELSVRTQELYAEYTLANLVERAEKAGISRGHPGYMYFI